MHDGSGKSFVLLCYCAIYCATGLSCKKSLRSFQKVEIVEIDFCQSTLFLRYCFVLQNLCSDNDGVSFLSVIQRASGSKDAGSADIFKIGILSSMTALEWIQFQFKLVFKVILRNNKSSLVF